MIMIYYGENKIKKRLHVLEAEIIKIKKDRFDISGPKDVSFTGPPLHLSQ